MVQYTCILNIYKFCLHGIMYFDILNISVQAVSYIRVIETRNTCLISKTCHNYNQPDFVQVESLLETYRKSCGVNVIFLPKFHCELNFIEQCWGYAKRIYQHYPPSSKEADLEQNLLSALKSVPVESMRK